MASQIQVPYNISYLFLAHVHIGNALAFTLFFVLLYKRGRNPHISLVAEKTEQGPLKHLFRNDINSIRQRKSHGDP